jgi:hypothetical protein
VTRLSERKPKLHRSDGRCAGGGSTRGTLANFLRRFTRLSVPAIKPVDPLVVDGPALAPMFISARLIMVPILLEVGHRVNRAVDTVDSGPAPRSQISFFGAGPIGSQRGPSCPA